MKTVQATKFKAQCLALLDNVAQTREPLIITKHGVPVATVQPIINEQDQQGTPLKGLATFVGDIISPVLEIAT